ncbi:MAG: hypothetical protein ACK44N_03930 [Bacteroidota bacterium]|jgi:cell division protein FtsB
MQKTIVILLMLFYGVVAQAQIQMSNSALVNAEFNTPLFREDFDSASTDWPTLSNFNNLFMIQNGSYYMNRKVKGEPYAVLSSKKINASAFQLNVRINPIEIGIEGYVGVLFMLQESSIGGYIFEIGPLSKYRLRQVKNGLYVNITGDSKSNGWVTSEGLVNYNQNNIITIACQNRSYDLMINSKRLLSFNDIEYKEGSFGILIGPETKLSIDNIVVTQTEKSNQAVINNNSIITETSAAVNVEIAKLKATIEKLQNDNDELALVVETMKAKGYTSPDDFESKYVSSVAAYNSLKLKYDSLVNEYLFVNNKYDSLKSAQTMTSAVDPEIDALMLELDDTKQKNHELEKENAALNRKLKKLNAGSSKK